MKKIFLTSALALTISVPSIADTVNPNIAANNNGSASCTEPVLGTTSGTSNLQADWTPNTIYIEWFGADGQITPENNTANSCTYERAITVPATNPTKEGYTFAGWTVKSATAPVPAAQCNIPSSYLSEEVGTFASKEIGGDVCNGMESGSSVGTSNGGSCSDSNFAGLNYGQWSMTFSSGAVKGEAVCSSTNGTYAQTGTPNETGGGQYCWCKVTNYIPNNGDSCGLSSSWVFFDTYSMAVGCANNCANECAYEARDVAAFRAAVFGLAQ